MLEPYQELMLLLFDAIPAESFSKWTAALTETDKSLGGPEVYRQSMRQEITTAFERLKSQRGASQIEPSQGANVMAQCVNSGVLFRQTFHPDEVTLEDLFTLCHQNSIAALACFQPEWNVSRFPPALKDMLGAVSRINKLIDLPNMNLAIVANLTSHAIAYPLITSTFNLPIKYHSGKITVQHNLCRNQTTVQFNIYGHNMNERMDLICLQIASNAWQSGIKIRSIPVYDENARQLSCALECEGNAEKIAELILQAAEDTIAGNFGGVRFVKANTLAKESPQALTEIAQSPGMLRQFALGSWTTKMYAWELIEAAVSQGEIIPIDACCALLREVGIKVRASDYPGLLAALAKAAKEEFTNNKSDAQERGYPIDPVKRFVMTEARRRTSCATALWNSISEADFPMFLSAGSGEVAGSSLFPNLCARYADYLLVNRQDGLCHQFAQYLAKQGQFASVITVQNFIQRPPVEFAPLPTGVLPPQSPQVPQYDEDGCLIEEEVEAPPAPREIQQCDLFDDALRAYRIPGRRAAAAEFSSEGSKLITDPAVLRPGQWILIPEARGRYGYVKELYLLAQVKEVTSDPPQVAVQVGGGITQALTSFQYLRLLNE